MKARDFCYWLQGYFELSRDNGLDMMQFQCIKAHLQMVFIHEKQRSPLLDFCHWLQSYLLGQSMISDCQVREVNKHLNQCFLHEIDPSFPDAEQAALNQAHFGFDSDNIMARC